MVTNICIGNTYSILKNIKTTFYTKTLKEYYQNTNYTIKSSFVNIYKDINNCI